MARRSLAELIDPPRTAVVTQECQGGVVGPSASLEALAREAEREAIPNLMRLLPAAREAGCYVVHCLFERRDDGLGSNRNARLFAATAGLGLDFTPGSPGATLLPELGPAPSDIVLTRLHGVGPMGGTDLGPVLRNLGVTSVIVTGVSVNVAIPSFVMDAVNAGFDVVLPRDAVAGIPADYATAVIDNTLSLLATVVATADLISAWTEGKS